MMPSNEIVLTLTLHTSCEQIKRTVTVIKPCRYEMIVLQVKALIKDWHSLKDKGFIAKQALQESRHRKSILELSHSHSAGQPYIQESQYRLEQNRSNMRALSDFRLFFISQKEEKELSEGMVFENEVHVVARLKDDPILIRKECQAAEKNFFDKILQFHDPAGLSVQTKTSKQSSEEYPSEITRTHNINVFLSNPLVTQEQSAFIQREQFESFGLPEGDSSASLNKVWKYDREPSTKELHQAFFKELTDAHDNTSANPGANASFKAKAKIDNAELKKIVKQEDGVMIRELHCAAETAQDGTVYLLLEDEQQMGVELRQPALSVLEQLPKESLLLVIGHRSDLVSTLARNGDGPLVIAINTVHFAADTLALDFLRCFYFRLFYSQDVVQLTLQTIQNAFFSIRSDLARGSSQKSIGSYICCCQHDHIPGCQFLSYVNAYGLNSSHLEFHRHCPIQISVCRNAGCSPKGLCSFLYQRFLGIKNPDHNPTGQQLSCYNFCCCHYQLKGNEPTKNQYHSIERKLAISTEDHIKDQAYEQYCQRTHPVATFPAKPATKHPFRVSTALLYKMVRFLAKSKNFDRQVKIIAISDPQKHSRVLLHHLLPTAEAYLSARSKSYKVMRSNDINLNNSYSEEFKKQLPVSPQKIKKTYESRTEYDTKIIVLTNCPPANGQQAEDLFLQILCQYADNQNKQAGLRLRIILAGQRQIKLRRVHEYRYQGFNIPESIHRSIQGSFQMFSGNPFTCIGHRMQALKLTTKPSLQIPPGPRIDTHKTFSMIEMNSKQRSEPHVNRYPEALLYLAVFPHGLTEKELNFLGKEFREWEKIIAANSSSVDVAIDRNWGEKRRIKAKIDTPMDRIGIKHEVIALKYLAQYCGAALYFSSNRKSANESMQQGSSLSTSGIFYYRRHQRQNEFVSIFEEQAELDKHNSVFKRYEEIARIVRQSSNLTCEEMFRMQEQNLLTKLQRRPVEYWESDEQLFHHYCVFVTNLSAVIKLYHDRGIQILLTPYVEYMIEQVKCIKRHPKSQALLYSQLMFTYLGILRLWGKTSLSNVDTIHTTFIELAKAWGSENQDVLLAWRMEYDLNQLLARTNLRTNVYQKDLFCTLLKKVYETANKLYNNHDRSQPNAMKFRAKLAILAAEGMEYAGVELADQMEGLFRGPANANTVQKLLYDLTIATLVLADSYSLSLRAKISIFNLRLVFEMLESSGQGEAIGRKKLQLIKHDIDEFQKQYFRNQKVELNETKLQQKLHKLNKQLKRRMNVHAKHTFIVLVAEKECSQASVPRAYQYEKITRFLQYGMNKLPKNSVSVLVNRLSARQLKRCCDSGAYVLFLFLNYTPGSDTVEVERFDDIGKETLSVAKFKEWIAMSSCRTIVIYGHHATDLIQFKVSGFSSSPNFVILDSSLTEAGMKDAESAARTHRAIFLRFVISYCDLNIRDPSKIYDNELLRNIERKINDLWPKLIEITIGCYGTDSPTFLPLNAKYRFWSEWTRVRSSNLQEAEMNTIPTIVCDDVLKIYRQVAISEGPLVNRCTVQQVIGSSSQCIAMSVARLLRYYNRFKDGIFYIKNAPPRRVMREIICNSRNQGLLSLSSKIYQGKTKELENILLVLHIEGDIEEQFQKNIAGFVRAAESIVKYILISSQHLIKLPNCSILECCKQTQLKELYFDFKSLNGRNQVQYPSVGSIADLLRVVGEENTPDAIASARSEFNIDVSDRASKRFRINMDWQ